MSLKIADLVGKRVLINKLDLVARVLGVKEVYVVEASSSKRFVKLSYPGPIYNVEWVDATSVEVYEVLPTE